MKSKRADSEAMDRVGLGSAHGIVARGVAIVVVGCGLAALTGVEAEEFAGPSFRRGMWQFERTLEYIGPSRLPQHASFLQREEMMRCVDPTESMKETFKPLTVGACHSVKPEKVDNRYVFSMRCDYLGPVRTVIEVEGDAAYTEINELTVGNFPRKDTVIARRVGDCER
jgi:hypothetical protein